MTAGTPLIGAGRLRGGSGRGPADTESVPMASWSQILIDVPARPGFLALRKAAA
jgi:hypothetical protein